MTKKNINIYSSIQPRTPRTEEHQEQKNKTQLLEVVRSYQRIVLYTQI